MLIALITSQKIKKSHVKIKENEVDIEGFLRSIPADKVYYCPNPGNAGDSAIATATYQLFDKIGLQYQRVGWNESFDATGKTVVYGGGGNLTKEYGHARTFIERHHGTAKQVILLPHTIKGNADILHELGENVYLFCRERRSFEWVNNHTNGTNVYLADDLAFRLNPQKLVGKEVFSGAKAVKRTSSTLLNSTFNSFAVRCLNSSKVTQPTLKLREAVSASKEVLGRLAGGGQSALYALRTDAERTTNSLPSSNIDVSQIFKYGTSPQSVAEKATAAMLSFFGAYDRVITNRLHGCILASLVGSRVDFYANNYFKNREVYRYSIEGRFPTVRWCGEWKGEEK
jgi:exopolysaccharide biosynthesis predicted pyruvyltransferase EpsI